jgi:peptide/nickel transport system substrate-binding protein
LYVQFHLVHILKYNHMNIKHLAISIALVGTAILGMQQCKKDSGRGNEVVIGLISEPQHLNIITGVSQGYTRQVVERHIYAFLGEINSNTGIYETFLAKSAPTIGVVDTGKYKGQLFLTYEILDEATWDNGSPITAHDFVFTLSTILNPKVDNKWRGYADFIGDVKVDVSNPKRFTVFTKVKNFQSQETIDNLPILPAYHYDPQGIMKNYSISELNDKAKLATLGTDARLGAFATAFMSNHGREKNTISGAGAYALESWEAGQRLVLKKKANWWGDKLASSRPMLQANPESIVYKFYNNNQASITDLKSGALDILASIAPKDFKALKEDAKIQESYQALSLPTTRLSGINLNIRNPKFADKRVRKAIAHAIDVPEIITKIFQNDAQILNTIVLPMRPYNRKDLPAMAYDPAKAKQLLAEAGWTDSNGNGTVDKNIAGKQIEMTASLLVPNKGTMPDIAILIQNTLKQVGVGIEIVAKENNAILEDTKKYNFEMSATTWAGQTWDNFEQKWHSKQGSNETGFGNPSLDALIDQINTSFDEQKRMELYRQFQGIIYEEQPVIMLVTANERLIASKRFQNITTSLNSPYYIERYLKIK